MPESTISRLMRGITHTHYGSEGNLILRNNLNIPSVVKPDDVLVRVHATTMHADIWHVINGRPKILVRILGAGFFGPGGRIPGTDLSGVVEKVGSAVTRLKPGDRVIGEAVRSNQWTHGGTFADYATAPEKKLVLKPTNMSFLEAAAIPTAGLIACQAVFDEGKVKEGDKVLVNGAGGAVGFFALQIAKSLGASLTAVDGPNKLDMLRNVGEDITVLDYTVTDFTAQGEKYDVIIDIPGNFSVEKCFETLTPTGRYVYIGHDGYGKTGGPWLGSMPRFASVASAGKKRGQKAFVPSPDFTERLGYLAKLASEGSLKPIIGRVFPLEEVPAALKCLESEDVVGRIMIEVSPSIEDAEMPSIEISDQEAPNEG